MPLQNAYYPPFDYFILLFNVLKMRFNIVDIDKSFDFKVFVRTSIVKR